MEQGSPEWFSARLGVLTGTTFKACMSKGAARKTLIYTKVAEILTDQIPDEISAASLEWGNENEILARDLYEFTYGKVEQVGIIYHPDTPWVGISPDGLVGEDGGLEIKCPKTPKEHVRHALDGLPADYKPQVQGALWVTGRKWWDFCSYDPRMPASLQLIRHRVYPDEKYIGDLSQAVMSAAEEVAGLVEKLRKE